MIIYAFMSALISIIDVILTPITFVNNIFGNIIENTGLVALIRFTCFVFDVELFTFMIDNLLLWFLAFILRPLINFIRNKS